MSLVRSIRRARARKNGIDWVVKERPFVVHPDGGYSVLRPTKGWIKVSGKRVRHGLARAF